MEQDQKTCECVAFQTLSDGTAFEFCVLHAKAGEMRTALEWYLADDERSVEMGILESVDKRPAFALLKDIDGLP